MIPNVAPENLGQPDLKLASFELWIHGRQFPGQPITMTETGCWSPPIAGPLVPVFGLMVRFLWL